MSAGRNDEIHVHCGPFEGLGSRPKILMTERRDLNDVYVIFALEENKSLTNHFGKPIIDVLVRKTCCFESQTSQIGDGHFHKGWKKAVVLISIHTYD